jgi:hypothetical protein
VSDRVALRLEFGEGVAGQVRARMSYAFRVFGAVYGHDLLDDVRPKRYNRASRTTAAGTSVRPDCLGASAPDSQG